MTNERERILSIARQGVSDEQIAEETGFSIEVIKGITGGVRNIRNLFNSEGFCKEFERELTEHLYYLAKCSENDSVRLKATIWLLDEAKGRNKNKVNIDSDIVDKVGDLARKVLEAKIVSKKLLEVNSGPEIIDVLEA